MTTKEYLDRLGLADSLVAPGFYLSDLIQLYHDHQHAEKLLNSLRDLAEQ